MAFPEDSSWARSHDHQPKGFQKKEASHKDLEDIYNELQDLANTLNRGYAIDADLQDLIQRVYGMLR